MNDERSPNYWSEYDFDLQQNSGEPILTQFGFSTLVIS